MPSRFLAVALAGVVTALAGFSVAGVGPYSGPQIARLSTNHGVHLGDVPVFLLWLSGILCCAVLARRR